MVSGYDEIGHGQTVEQLPRNLILSRPTEIAYIAGNKRDIRHWHKIVQVFDGAGQKSFGVDVTISQTVTGADMTIC